MNSLWQDPCALKKNEAMSLNKEVFEKMLKAMDKDGDGKCSKVCLTT